MYTSVQLKLVKNSDSVFEESALDALPCSKIAFLWTQAQEFSEWDDRWQIIPKKEEFIVHSLLVFYH